MGESVAVLIGAVIALAGSVAGSWSSRKDGIRQAEALLDSVRMTTRAEARQRALTQRREVYAEFLAAAESGMLSSRGGGGRTDDTAVLHKAAAVLVLEGPEEVAAAAQELVAGLRRHDSAVELDRAKKHFTATAQQALRSLADE